MKRRRSIGLVSHPAFRAIRQVEESDIAHLTGHTPTKWVQWVLGWPSVPAGGFPLLSRSRRVTLLVGNTCPT